tara:strand:- start:9 stop:2033 length:2025 start_codon:yes stop_codon:yes gene_type:complete
MNEEQFILKIVVDDGQFLVKLPNAEKKVKDLGQAMKFAEKNSKQFSKSLKENKHVNDDMISSAGLAGATLTEFGRTVSDLPFGITAITNNLSQLGTLFTTLVAKTGGTTNAFKLLGDQLAKGPLAIILVFQVLIALLQQFQKGIVDFIMGVEGANKATKELRSNFFNLTESIKENNKELKKQDKDITRAINKLERQTKILIRNRDKQRNANQTLEEFNKANSTTIMIMGKRVEALRELGIEVDETRLLEEGYVESLREGEGTINNISDKLNQRRIDLEKERISGRKTDVELLQAEIALFVDTQESLNVKAEQYLKSEEYQVLQARLAKAQNEAFLKARNERFAEEVEAEVQYRKDLAEATAALFEKDAESMKEPLTVVEDFYDDGIDSLLEFNKFREQFIELSELEILDILEQGAIKRLEKLAEESNGLIDFETEKTKIVEFFSNKRKEILNAELDQSLAQIQDMIAQVSSALNALTDAELSREERKTALLNNQLTERLRNEKLSADQKAAIEKQIENNEIALQKKRDKIAEKNFKLQKAAMIANALVETFRTGILAYGSQLIIGDPTSPIRAQIAQAIALATGLAQVAAIARTQFVPSAISAPSLGSSTGGAGGGQVGPTDPAFNIVGTGQQFQLAQVIAQRTGEPIRAFVVSGDVRTGLALDRNIINSSKIN